MTFLGRIRSWALLAVAVSSSFTIGIAIWLISILSAQDWCSRALGAAKYATGRPANAIDACFNLMNEQVGTLGTALLIVIGVQALSLAVLVIIVLAGGRVNFRASKEGVEADISRDVADAAKDVARAADDRADEIVEETQ